MAYLESELYLQQGASFCVSHACCSLASISTMGIFMESGRDRPLLCVQPLAMDWREKIKAAKGRPAEKPKAATVKAQPKKYASKPDLEALSGGLPPGWKALWDKQSGEIYYGNPTTKVGKASHFQWALPETARHLQFHTECGEEADGDRARRTQRCF